MDTSLKTGVWLQFGAAIDTLADALRACPEELWGDNSQHTIYWYTVYHTLFWLDLYLDGPEEGFVPPAPFALIEMDSDGTIPERVYTKEELQTYLTHCRRKCQTTIMEMSDERAAEVIRFERREMPFAELQLYSMRHVQEHASQLNLILGQRYSNAPGWVSRAR